jgi:gamma-glutamyl-gamma-aminobutyrate hydrolase PuuD
VIEVLDPDDHSWPILAVQWHPEYLAVENDKASLALFAALVESAREAAYPQKLVE